MVDEGAFCGLFASVLREGWVPVDIQSTSGIGVNFCAAFKVLLGLWCLRLLGLLLWSGRAGLRWTCLGTGHEKSKWMVKGWRGC